MESAYSIGIPPFSLPQKSRSVESVFGGVEARRGGLTLLPLVRIAPFYFWRSIPGPVWGFSSSPGRRDSSPIRVSSFPRPDGKGLLFHRERRLSSPLLPPLLGCPRGWGFRTPRSPWAGLGNRVREAAAPDSRQWLLWRQRLL